MGRACLPHKLRVQEVATLVVGHERSRRAAQLRQAPASKGCADCIGSDGRQWRLFDYLRSQRALRPQRVDRVGQRGDGGARDVQEKLCRCAGGRDIARRGVSVIKGYRGREGHARGDEGGRATAGSKRSRGSRKSCPIGGACAARTSTQHLNGPKPNQQLDATAGMQRK